MNLARKLLDNASFALLATSPGDRLVRYLSYQRKRAMRRRVEARLAEAGLYGDVVERGPFRGMKFLPRSDWSSCRFEKIIGAYEFEIADLISELAETKDYQRIINIGAADGFYSAGMALLFPNARVFSFEIQPSKRDYLDRFAKLNNVRDRIEIRSRCEVEDLQRFELTERDLIIMDVDGAEEVLLDVETNPSLKRCEVLVELHDCILPGLGEMIRSRFRPTHVIRDYFNAGLKYEDYPILHGLPFEEIYAMVGEDRSGLQDWAMMEPKST